MAEIIGGRLGRHPIEQFSDARGGLVLSPGIFLTKEGLVLGERLLDRVQVGAVGWQKDQLGTGRSDRASHGNRLMATGVVHHPNVALSWGWHHELDDPCQKADGVDRAIKHARGDDPIAMQTGHESQCFPVTMRHSGDQPLANGATSMQASHVRLSPCLINKDQALGINLALQPFPLLASSRYIMAVLLTGMEALF